MFVTVTLAPATAFPCGSVTAPTRFPYTAWPRDVLAPNPSVRQKTRTNPRIACFLIPPLLNTLNSWNRTDHGLNNRSEEHTSELQSHLNLVCRLLLEKKKKQ